MKKIGKFIVIAVAAVVILGTFGFLYKQTKPEEVTYEEINPEIRDIQKVAIVTGQIVPRNEVNVKPQITGIISELYKEAGQQVAEGEVIAKVKVIPEMSSLSSAQSRVRLSGINLEQAKTNYERDKALYDKQLISGEAFDQVRQSLEQAKEEYAAAEESLEVIRDGVSKSNASSSSTLIRSTISGLILDVPVKVGTSVILSNNFNDGTTIATVADMRDLIFDGKVDETEVGRLVEKMPVVISIGALQSLRLDASLEYISPKAISATGATQFQIKAAVNVPEDVFVRSGYSANAEVVLESADQVLSIPESTLEFDGDKTFVWKKTGEKQYEKAEIQTGLSDGVNIEVKSGITEGDILRGNKII